MSRILSHELRTDWHRKLKTIEDLTICPGDMRGNGVLMPTRQAMQRAAWLAVGMVDMGRKVDRIRRNNEGGLIFEQPHLNRTYRIEADGSCAVVEIIGDESSRRTELAGALP